MAKKEAKTKKETKNKKSFFKDFKAELKKVIWPTPKQLLNNTVAVITIVLITAAIVFVLDIVFETSNKHGIEKVKEIISTNETTTEDTTTDDTIVENEDENAVEENTEESNKEENVEVSNEEKNNEDSSQEDNTENNAE